MGLAPLAEAELCMRESYGRRDTIIVVNALECFTDYLKQTNKTEILGVGQVFFAALRIRVTKNILKWSTKLSGK